MGMFEYIMIYPYYINVVNLCTYKLFIYSSGNINLALFLSNIPQE